MPDPKVVALYHLLAEAAEVAQDISVSPTGLLPETRDALFHFHSSAAVLRAQLRQERQRDHEPQNNT